MSSRRSLVLKGNEDAHGYEDGADHFDDLAVVVDGGYVNVLALAAKAIREGVVAKAILRASFALLAT